MNLPQRRDGSVSREALERIIQRAAELQAGEREIGETLTEEEVKQLARDVGLPARYIDQALIEERHRVAPASGTLDRWMGPAVVQARRTVPGDAVKVSDALDHWMKDSELLVVKRHFPDRTSWEARNDFMAGVRRTFGVGGKRYILSRAKEVITQVDSLESGWCHVTLSADLSNSRTEYGAGVLVATGGAGLVAGAIVLMGFAVPLVAVPLLAGAGISAAVMQGRRGLVERVSVALEQILDGLERGEIRKKRPEPPKQGLLPKAIVDEVRKHLR